MMMKRFSVILVTLWTTAAVSLLLGQPTDAKPNYIPRQGVVPNKTTALRIAKAVLTPIYGKKAVEAEEPFVVTLKNGIWNIHGQERPRVGGNLYVEISRKKGCILRIYGTE